MPSSIVCIDKDIKLAIISVLEKEYRRIAEPKKSEVLLLIEEFERFGPCKPAEIKAREKEIPGITKLKKERGKFIEEEAKAAREEMESKKAERKALKVERGEELEEGAPPTPKESYLGYQKTCLDVCGDVYAMAKDMGQDYLEKGVPRVFTATKEGAVLSFDLDKYEDITGREFLEEGEIIPPKLPVEKPPVEKPPKVPAVPKVPTKSPTEFKDLMLYMERLPRDTFLKRMPTSTYDFMRRWVKDSTGREVSEVFKKPRPGMEEIYDWIKEELKKPRIAEERVKLGIVAPPPVKPPVEKPPPKRPPTKFELRSRYGKMSREQIKEIIEKHETGEEVLTPVELEIVKEVWMKKVAKPPVKVKRPPVITPAEVKELKKYYTAMPKEELIEVAKKHITKEELLPLEEGGLVMDVISRKRWEGELRKKIKEYQKKKKK